MIVLPMPKVDRYFLVVRGGRFRVLLRRLGRSRAEEQAAAVSGKAQVSAFADDEFRRKTRRCGGYYLRGSSRRGREVELELGLLGGSIVTIRSEERRVGKECRL